MSQIKNTFKNTGWAFISQITTSIFAFIWTILIARYLGVNDFGIYSFAVSFSMIIGLMLDLGVSTYNTREVSRNHDLASSYVGRLIPLKIFLSILMFVIGLIILIIMHKNELTIIVSLIFISEAIFMIMSNIFQGNFQAFEIIKYQTIGSIINSIVLLIGISISIYLNLGLIFISLSYLIAYIIMLIYYIIQNNKHVAKPKLEINIAFCKKAIKLSLPFALTSVFITLYFSIDTLMLSTFCGDFATGIYNASYKIISILTVFYSTYQVVIFPLMSKMFEDSEKILKLSFIKSIKYLLLIIMPLTLGIILYSKNIINLIFGSGYEASINVLCIIIWSVSFLYINGAFTNLFNATNKETIVSKIYGINALVNIILNIILIPKYTYIGASISTVISEVFICAMMVYVVRKTPYCPDKNIFKDVFKIIVASLVMFGVLQFISNMWIGLVVGILVYSGTILLLRILDDDDKYVIHELIGR